MDDRSITKKLEKHKEAQARYREKKKVDDEFKKKEAERIKKYREANKEEVKIKNAILAKKYRSKDDYKEKRKEYMKTYNAKKKAELPIVEKPKSILELILEYTEEIKDEADNDKANKIKEYIMKIEGIEDSTRANYLSITKKKLVEKGYFQDNSVANIIGDTELYGKLIKKRDDDREEKDIKIFDMDVIRQILMLKETKDVDGVNRVNGVYGLYLYLLFVSGLRTNELWDNEITYMGRDTIEVKNISKREHRDDKYTVYTLIEAFDFIKLYNEFKELLKEKNIKFISISKILDNHIKKIDNRLHTHMLRGLYIYYQTKIRDIFPTMIQSQKVKKLLNHVGETTSVFYNDVIRIEGAYDIIKEDNKTYLKTLKVKELRERCKEIGIDFNNRVLKKDLIKRLE